MSETRTRAYDRRRRHAKRLFVHYMNFTWESAGLRVDSDNVAEWEDIVDSIIDAAFAKTMALVELRLEEQGNE